MSRDIPNMDDPFDLKAATDARRRYENATDAEIILDEEAFTKAYTFAAHRSARHLHAAIPTLQALTAENARLVASLALVKAAHDKTRQILGADERLETVEDAAARVVRERNEARANALPPGLVTRVQWAVRYPDGYTARFQTEAAARRFAAMDHDEPLAVVWRTFAYPTPDAWTEPDDPAAGAS